MQAKKHGETDIGSETHQDGAQVRHVAEKAKDIHDRRISSKVRSGLIVGGDALTLESRPRARLCTARGKDVDGGLLFLNWEGIFMDALQFPRSNPAVSPRATQSCGRERNVPSKLLYQLPS